MLYWEVDAAIVGAISSDSPGIPSAQVASNLVLAGVYGIPAADVPSVIPAATLDSTADAGTCCVEPKELRPVPGAIACQLPAQSDRIWMLVDAPRVVLPRSVVVIALPSLTDDEASERRLLLDSYLYGVTPTLEVVFRREVQESMLKLREEGRTLESFEPHKQLLRSFADACQLLGVEGGSLFAQLVGQPPDTLQLLATTPRLESEGPPVYPSSRPTPTSVAIKFGRDCVIPDVHTFRKTLPHRWRATSSIWSDIKDDDVPRTLLYVFYTTNAGCLYVLRCTNSLKNPSRQFHALDLLKAKEFVAWLSLLHRAYESEYRAMRIFLDASHELRQRLMGIRSAANFVRKSFGRSGHSTKMIDERSHKIKHILTSVDQFAALLTRFNPLTPAVFDEGPRTSFRPYADLVRPICEMLGDDARERGLRFTYHGQDQLREIRASLNDFMQVIENLARNAVKYTHPNEEIAVAFERQPGGGGRIHFASRSLKINAEESRRLFEFRFRTRAATKLTDDGDGLGLAISKFLIVRYGGDITFRSEHDVNIFSVIIPPHLFDSGVKRNDA